MRFLRAFRCARHRAETALVPNRLTLDSRLGAVLIVGALGIAAFVHPLRPPLALGLAVAFVAARRSGRPTNVLAAVLPVAAILSWGTFAQPLADPTGAQCADPFAPPAVWRFVEALVGLIVLALVLRGRGATAADIGLRLGSRRVAILAAVGLFVVAPLALLGGSLLGSSLLGESFFGTFALDLSQPAALAPAMLFAASNALAEELAYRGAMRTWLTPALGIVGANLAQAIVFGLAHSGDDFVGVAAVLPTMAAMVAVGFVGGIIARRTGSLTLVLALHAAADIPIYFYWACRVS